MLAQRLSPLGALNSLSQAWRSASVRLIRARSFDFSLVDPDNRRPVDFGERTRVLASPETPD
jgi:(1->4)-alpha-D-glucan 1-alpha-D-glucosylmutase